MSDLTHRQWMQLQETLLGLHEHHDLATFPAFILDQLHQIFDCDTASLCDDRGGLREVPWLRSDSVWTPLEAHDTKAQGYMMCSPFDPDFHQLREEFLACFPAQPPPRKIQELNEGKVLRLLDSTTQSEFQDSQIYSDVYRPMNIHQELSVFISIGERELLTVAVSRSCAPFSEVEVRQLDFLQRHLRIAYRHLLAEHNRRTAWETWQSPQMPHGQLASRLAKKWQLTPRELEILHWLGEGKLNTEIAVILDSSRHTIRKHVEHILQKLHVENRQMAARLYLEAWQLATLP